MKKLLTGLFTGCLGVVIGIAQPILTAERNGETVLLKVAGETNRSYTLTFSSDLIEWRDTAHVFGSTNLFLSANGLGFYTLKTYPPLSRSPRKLFVNINADPQSAIVNSEVSVFPIQVPSMVRGDKLAINLYLVSGDGAFDISSGAVESSITVVIGEVAQTAYAKTTNFVPIPNGWQGVVDLTSAALRERLSGRESDEFIFQVELSNIATGETKTVVAQPVQIYNRLN